jgi:hypothetical protein
MTPKEIMARWFADRDAEAERYRDKQMGEPTSASDPRVIRLDYLIGTVVYLKVAENQVAGMVTGVGINPSGAVYYITWGDTRTSTPHYACELTTERPF